MKKLIPYQLFIIIVLVLQASCLSPSNSRIGRFEGRLEDGELGNSNGNGSGAGQGEDNLGGGTTTIEPRSELRHLVDPFEGTYKTKLTIPKNYTGYFYIAGLNITSLRNKLVHVRFSFGREYEPVTVPAVIGRAPGLIPQTDIEVLILDMRDKPFENIRLIYDLFDYNKYSNGDTAVTDNTDGGLYCRGLRLIDDPTWMGTDGACNNTGEKCYYAYAKIVDQGLVSTTTGFSKLPSEPNVDLSGSDYSSPSGATALANNLFKCLPDGHAPVYNAAGPYLDPAGGISATINSGIVVHNDGTDTFEYKGPYRFISENTWEISGNALVYDHVANDTDPTGLFMQELTANTPKTGIVSYLFPRSGTMSLGSNITYLGFANSLGSISYGNAYVPTTESIQSLLTSGTSNFLNGCSIRVSNYDSTLNEGIQSCNVTATITVVTIDPLTGNEQTVVGDTDEIDRENSKKLKLQLVRSSLENYEGNEVLYSALKTCSTSRTCGSGECCYNSRCWSKDLVYQCLEDADTNGNLTTGESCTTDYQCASLCCSASTGTCTVHDTTLANPVLCSKPPGSACVAREWCRKENMRDCRIIKTGVDISGNTTCALRCYNVPTHGGCKNGVCVAPTPIPVPSFNPANPDCSNAQDPPTSI